MTELPTERGFAEVEGARLYYEVAGRGHPLLLLHAGIADSRMWDAQFKRFAQDYTVIRCDLPGFGKSPMLPGRFASHEQVANLLHFFDIPHARVVGISYGGRIALDFTLMYPEMVTALVLVAPVVGGQPPLTALERFAEDEEAALAAGDLDAATELNLRMWVDGPYRRPDQVDPVVREQVRQMQHYAFTIPWPEGVQAEPLTPPAITRLGEIRAPTLIISGALDIDEIRTLADRLADEIPDAKQVVIPDGAHLVSMEHPETFNRTVLAFLDEE